MQYLINLILKIAPDCLTKVKELVRGMVLDDINSLSYVDLSPNTLRSFGLLLDVFEPPESKLAIKRILLRAGEKVESIILDESEENGWYYSKINPNINQKIMALLAIGHKFVGSYSEALYSCLDDYINRFKTSEGFVFDNLWDVCFYFEVLLRLSREDYDAQTQDCVKLLNEALDTVNISVQLKAYILWLLYQESKTKKIDLNFNSHVDELLSNISNSSLEIKLWILFTCVELDVLPSVLEKAIETLISQVTINDLWKKSTKTAFLAFSSSILFKTSNKIEIPYVTFSLKESPFFGIIAETILTAVSDIEKERKTKNFDENSLRNRFLAVLKARFGGLASAESFRCNGHTDITVINPKNHCEEVVIECKIWRGKQYYQKGIDQAMGYLTNSENRVILLVFFKDTDFFSERNKLEDAIQSQNNYVENSLSNGIIDRHTFFNQNYLFSWHKSKTEQKIGVHHIYAVL